MKTGLVRWEWHSLDHIKAAESEVEVPSGKTPWDYFHINSIDRQSNGNLLISARSTWAGYQLQAGTGLVLWRLGGNHSSFKMGPGTEMAWQHDGRMLDDGTLTFFDDGSNPPIHKQSRGLKIAIDPRAKTARLVKSWVHPDPPMLAASQGNMQTLSDGSVLIGYGGVPQISQFSADGSLLFDAHQPYDMSFYRAFRFPWSARPATPPAILASANDTGEETIVHASWNGATGVASWRVLAGESKQSLAARATMPAAAFENSITLPHKYKFAAVEALDGAGHCSADLAPSSVIGFYAALDRGRWQARCLVARLATCDRVWSSSSRPASWCWCRGSTSWSRSSISRRRPTAQGCSPARRRALAWRSVAFSSWAGLRSSHGGWGAHPSNPLSASTPSRRAPVSAEATAAPRAPETRRNRRHLAPRLGLLLAVCCAAQFMVILDLSIVNVALPSIQSDLDFSRRGCSGSSTPTRSRSPAS